MEYYSSVLTRFSRARLFVTLWTITRQAPLSMGFSRQEYQSGLLCPSPGDFPDPGIKPMSLTSPALEGRFFTTNTVLYLLIYRKEQTNTCYSIYKLCKSCEGKGKWKERKGKSLSRVQLFATPWTAASQAPPSMGFPRQEDWSGPPFPSPGDLPDSGIEPRSPAL